MIKSVKVQEQFELLLLLDINSCTVATVITQQRRTTQDQ